MQAHPKLVGPVQGEAGQVGAGPVVAVGLGGGGANDIALSPAAPSAVSVAVSSVFGSWSWLLGAYVVASVSTGAKCA